MAEIKSVPCADCGKRFPPYVMDFHHTDRNKEFGVASGKNRNFNKVLTEIAKCVILCANCHRIREYASGQAPSFGAR